MALSTAVVHLLLAVVLFFLVNWIGRHSISSGYLQLSLFAKTDEAPAFNFLFRVFAPIVYLVVVASLLYYLHRDDLVRGFFLVAVYYVLIRGAFNILTGRGRLLNWASQLVVGLAVCWISYLAYTNLISQKHSLLPDFASIGNELWIIVLVFLYQAANKITLSPTGTLRRKHLYLERRYHSLRRQYGAIIEQEASGFRIVGDLAYAVLIYETFNRPTVYRWIESAVLFPFRLSKTLGPMQVQTDRRIDDEESVRLGVRKLRSDYRDLGGSPEGDPYLLQDHVIRTLKRYNVRSDYPNEVYLLYIQVASRHRQEEIQERRATSSHPGTEPTP